MRKYTAKACKSFGVGRKKATYMCMRAICLPELKAKAEENPTLVDVYFDDVVMTHTKSNVIQYNEYYPFGLQTANS